MLKPLSALTGAAASMMLGGDAPADATMAEWQRSKFKLNEGRWVLGSERGSLTSLPSPSTAAVMGGGRTKKAGGRGEAGDASASPPASSSSSLSSSLGSSVRRPHPLGIDVGGRGHIHSCKSVVAGLAAVVDTAAAPKAGTEGDGKGGSGARLTFLALGNETALGIFDGAAVEDGPLRYAKATDIRGFNNSYPTAIAVQRHTAADSTRASPGVDCVGGTAPLLLGMSTGEVLCLASILNDARTAGAQSAGEASSPQSQSQASPTKSPQSTPSTSPIRAGAIISKAFGASSSSTAAPSAGVCGSTVTFHPEGALDADVKCTCLSFLSRMAAPADRQKRKDRAAVDLFAAAYSDGSIIFYDISASKDPKADPGFSDGGGKKEGGDDEAANASYSRQSTTTADDLRHAAPSAVGGQRQQQPNDGVALDSMLGGMQLGGGGGLGVADTLRSEHDPVISYSKNPKAAALQRWQLGKSASSSSQQLSFSSSFLPNNNNIINAMEVSPDSSYIATGSRDGLIRIIRVATGKLLSGVKSYYGATLCLAWSPDSRLLLRCAKATERTHSHPHSLTLARTHALAHKTKWRGDGDGDGRVESMGSLTTVVPLSFSVRANHTQIAQTSTQWWRRRQDTRLRSPREAGDGLP